MSLVLNRDDIKKGIGNPNGVHNADFIGQMYIDTNTNEVYISHGLGDDGWERFLMSDDEVDLTSSAEDAVVDRVQEIVSGQINAGMLEKPALQIGVTGGVVDINSDLYVKGDMYLWDAAFVEGNIVIDGTDEDFYSIKQDYWFENSAALGLTPEQYEMACEGISIVKIKIPKETYYKGSVISVNIQDKSKQITDPFYNEAGPETITYRNTLYRFIKEGKVVKYGSLGLKENNSYPTTQTIQFNYDEGYDSVEFAVNSQYNHTGVLTLTSPNKSDKVWTQRNWSPTMIISNTDELDAMEENQTRTVLLQKIKQFQYKEVLSEPTTPTNGEYIKFTGSNSTIESTKGIIGGSNGNYFETGKCYEFQIVDGKWHVVEENSIPQTSKPILLVSEQDSNGNIVAQSTNTDSAAMFTALGNPTTESLQSTDPVLDNNLLQTHSGFNSSATSADMWNYSAYATELRLNAIKNISRQYTDNSIGEVRQDITNIQNTIDSKVDESISDFANRPNNYFSKLDVMGEDKNGQLSLTTQANAIKLDFFKNSDYSANSELSIGEQGVINTIRLNADKIIFDGVIENSNGRQDISLPSLKLTTPNQNFINSQTTAPALDLNNGAIARTSQIVFSGSPDVPMGLFFPRFDANQAGRYMGNYDYINVRDGLLRTSAVISSDRNYIILDGKRIFFSPTQPTRAEDGDIWIQI